MIYFSCNAGENMIMDRKFYQILKDWEENKVQKPLMVIGVRQVGKTWLIRKFCEENYPDYIYVNLEKQEDIRSIFDLSVNPERIIPQMEQILGRKIGTEVPVFLDEIQTSERAITSLKYFCEAEENYRVICAGSLLGVKIARFQSSFPVGKVQIVRMYPMDFEEFLQAAGESLLADGIRTAYLQHEHLSEGVHGKALRLYRDYLYIGGMPEAVENYVKNDRNVIGIDENFYESLHFAYLADMTRYVKSPAESVKITEVYHSVPRQLAKDNPKFKYSEVKSGANKRDYGGPVDWLKEVGMIYQIHDVELPKEPLKGYENEDQYKIYLSDTGLLSNLCGLQYRNLLPDAVNPYKGPVVENYVFEQMIQRHAALYYFKPSDTMEVDLLFDSADGVIPVEIKSGRRKRSTSLRNFCERYKPAYAIRFSELNFGWTGGIYSIPLYAAFCV